MASAWVLSRADVLHAFVFASLPLSRNKMFRLGLLLYKAMRLPSPAKLTGAHD